jgi:hypothetical protein
MSRVAVAVVLAAALGDAVLAHTVFAQHPPAPGTGRPHHHETEQAIRAMVVPHGAELDRMPEWSATTVIIPGGVRLTVVAKHADDTKLLARIRGLGFAGLMSQGARHPS